MTHVLQLGSQSRFTVKMVTRARAARTYGGRSADDRRAERRTRLLAAGRRAWGESGLTGVTVRGVCALAGLTDRYFYESFANREALVLAVADQLRDEMLAVMVQGGLAASGGVEAKLRGGLNAILRAATSDPATLRIFTSDPADLPALAQQRRVMLTMITDLVIQFVPEVLTGEVDAHQLRLAALFSVGGVNQLIESWIDGSLVVSTEQLGADCARLCVSVLGPLA
jgi:AcrR family transcriptional regulator